MSWSCKHCGGQNESTQWEESVEHKLDAIIEQGVHIVSAQDNINAGRAAQIGAATGALDSTVSNLTADPNAAPPVAPPAS